MSEPSPSTSNGDAATVSCASGQPPASTDTTTSGATLPLPLPTDPSYVYQPAIHSKLKSLFDETITHPAIIIPSRQTAELRRTLSHVLMHRPKMKDVYEVPQSEFRPNEDSKSVRKLALKQKLDEPITLEDGAATANTTTTTDVYADAELKKVLSTGSESNGDNDTIRKSTHSIQITYNHYTVEEVLRRILPSSIKEVPSSFESAGHLAHINLREEMLPYKFIIGKTILDKNPGVAIVVNKIGTIENEFRTFPMEILARREGSINNGAKDVGNKPTNSPDLEVEVKEEGCKFRLDFAKVYWNSRLQFEHRRLVELIAGEERVANQQRKNGKRKKKRSRASDAEACVVDTCSEPIVVVADIMAGVGPFSVPLTSRFQGIICHANDLNPISYNYLKENAKLNKCNEEALRMYNMDGRAFVHHLEKQGIWFDHAIMNLPASAPEFLDAFRGWNGFRARCAGSEQRPMIHVHCFGGKDDKADDEAIARCEKALGCSLDKAADDVSVYIVRDVSPKKNMLCVSFLLPLGVKETKRINLSGGGMVEEETSPPGDMVEEETASPPVDKKARIS